jgi:hypothetical protein
LTEVDLPIQSNEHRNKTGQQTNTALRRYIKQRHTEMTKTQKKNTKERSNLYDNHLFRLKTRKKKEQRDDFRPKMT